MLRGDSDERVGAHDARLTAVACRFGACIQIDVRVCGERVELVHPRLGGSVSLHHQENGISSVGAGALAGLSLGLAAASASALGSALDPCSASHALSLSSTSGVRLAGMTCSF